MDRRFHTKTIAILCACQMSGLAFGILAFGCQQGSEPAPFFDGLYLIYEEVMAGTPRPEGILWIRKIHYRFGEGGDGTFKISQEVHTERGQRLKKGIEPVAYPQAGADLAVDKTGIVLSGGDQMTFIEGYPSYLWLPPKYRKEGASVIPIVRKVKEKAEWKSRKVWPVVFGQSEIQVHYYDPQTGFLIGMESLKGKMSMMLIETNHEALKAALPEKLNRQASGLR